MSASTIFAIVFMTLWFVFLLWVEFHSRRQIARSSEVDKDLHFDQEAILRLENEGGRTLPRLPQKAVARRVGRGNDARYFHQLRTDHAPRHST